MLQSIRRGGSCFARAGALLSQEEAAEKKTLLLSYLHHFPVNDCFIFPSTGVSHRVADGEFVTVSQVIKTLEEFGWVRGMGKGHLLSSEEWGRGSS